MHQRKSGNTVKRVTQPATATLRRRDLRRALKAEKAETNPVKALLDAHKIAVAYGGTPIATALWGLYRAYRNALLDPAVVPYLPRLSIPSGDLDLRKYPTYQPMDVTEACRVATTVVAGYAVEGHVKTVCDYLLHGLPEAIALLKALDGPVDEPQPSGSTWHSLGIFYDHGDTSVGPGYETPEDHRNRRASEVMNSAAGDNAAWHDRWDSESGLGGLLKRNGL